MNVCMAETVTNGSDVTNCPEETVFSVMPSCAHPPHRMHSNLPPFPEFVVRRPLLFTFVCPTDLFRSSCFFRRSIASERKGEVIEHHGQGMLRDVERGP